MFGGQHQAPVHGMRGGLWVQWVATGISKVVKAIGRASKLAVPHPPSPPRHALSVARCDKHNDCTVQTPSVSLSLSVSEEWMEPRDPGGMESLSFGASL